MELCEIIRLLGLDKPVSDKTPRPKQPNIFIVDTFDRATHDLFDLISLVESESFGEGNRIKKELQDQLSNRSRNSTIP